MDLSNCSDEEREEYWTNFAKEKLVGRTIKSVQYMTKGNAEENYWHSRPLLLILDNDEILVPMSDDEGNNGGVLTMGEATFPVLMD